MVVTRDDLFNSPDHYLHSFEGDTAVFVPMDRDAFYRSIFLDGRISPAASGSMALPIASLGAPGASAPVGWIFHLAHCGSTLLSRALDDPASNLVLREPQSLRDVAFEFDADRLALAKAMIGKRYRDEAPNLVKASVPVNFILPHVLGDGGTARAIFLHCSLRDYLLAVLRTPGHRNWIARVTQFLLPHLGDLTALTVAERGAALWLGQMKAFAQAMVANPATVSLDCERFYVTPQPALVAAAGELGIMMTTDAIQRAVAGPLFATHAKMPAHAFDNATRLLRRAELERQLASELDRAQIWLEKAGGPPTLPRPLLS